MRAFAVHCGGFCRASVLYRSKTLTYSPQLVSSACLVCPDGSRRGAARYRTRTIKAPHGNPASPRPFRHTASPDLSVHLSNRHRQEKQHAREPGDLLHVLVSRSRPVREGHKPQCGHVRAGEVGLCRTTCEPAEQGRATFRGGGGREGHRRGRTSINRTCTRHRAGSACPRDCAVCGKQHVSPPLIHGKSRMRKSARTDLRGGRSAMVVPTATVTILLVLTSG